MKLGYDALKFDPFPGPWRSFVDHADLELAAAKVGAVREAVGPRVEILIEVHRRLSPIEAIMVGRMIEKYRPYWFEEPCPPENIRGIAEVKNALNIPDNRSARRSMGGAALSKYSSAGRPTT